MAHIVALLTDCELAAELAVAAGAGGHDIDVCSGEAEAWDACEEQTALLVIDASSDAIDGVTLVDSMRAGGELGMVRTLAFHRDDDPASKARAEQVGFDLIVPRSSMAAEGAHLIAPLLA